MKRKIITLIAALLCASSLVACGEDIAKEAAEKGRGYFDSGDYETAARAFGLSIDEGNEDDEIKLLYDITLVYHQANKAYKDGNYPKALEIIETINENYVNYGIKDSVNTLKNDIEGAISALGLMGDVARYIEEENYKEAISIIESIDEETLSPKQLEMLKEYKKQIADAQNGKENMEYINEELDEDGELPKEELPIDGEEIVSEPEPIPEAAEEDVEPTPEITPEPAPEVQKEPEKVEVEQPVITPEPKPEPKPAPEPPKQGGVAEPKPGAATAPVINVYVANDKFIYPSDTTLLTVDMLANLSKEDVNLIRNEIYARKGHIFNSGVYADYFSGKTWYTPIKKIYWEDLNEIERENIRRIREYENSI